MSYVLTETFCMELMLIRQGPMNFYVLYTCIQLHVLVHVLDMPGCTCTRMCKSWKYLFSSVHYCYIPEG